MPALKPDVTDVRRILRKYGGEFYSYDYSLCKLLSRLFVVDLDTFPDEDENSLTGSLLPENKPDNKIPLFYTYSVTIREDGLPLAEFEYPSLNFTKFRNKLISEFEAITSNDTGFGIRERLINALKTCNNIKMIYLAFSLSNTDITEKAKYSIDIVEL